MVILMFVMIAIHYKNQDGNLLCSVKRKPIRYNFRSVMTPIRYSVKMIQYTLSDFYFFLDYLCTSLFSSVNSL